MADKIIILAACHKESYVPGGGGAVKSIQAGAAMRGHIGGMELYDDAGDNISDKNDRYCELTAQYFAWKNLDSDYYGFCHYRRYLSFGNVRQLADRYCNVKYDRFGDKFESEFGLDAQSIRAFIDGFDLIVPEPMDFKKDPKLSGKRKDVYSHYKHSLGHDVRDLDFALGYIRENLPEYAAAAEAYMESRFGYFLNMYVMTRELFFDYCEWLFPILDAFDFQRDYSGNTALQRRAAGFLAERLFGVYLYRLRQARPELKVKHTQQSLILNTDEPYPLPACGKNLVAAALGCDENYVPLAGVLLTSIAANASDENFYDIFVMENGISEESKNGLKSIVSGKGNFSLRFINGGGYIEDKALVEKHHINRSTYLRFSMLEFMKHYDKAIYLDCDTVVNRDIAELYNTDVGGYYFAAAIDTVQSVWCSYKKAEQLAYNERVVGLKDGFEYYNAGVMLLNLSAIRADYSAESLYRLAASRRWRWQDQDVLNRIARDGRVLELAGSWNVQVNARGLIEDARGVLPKRALDAHLKGMIEPYVIHYAGKHVPCFYPDAALAEFFWRYAEGSVFYGKLPVGAERRASGKSRAQKLADRMFPKGSRRRETAKRIYYFFRRKN